MKAKAEAVVSPPAQPWDIDCSKDVPVTKQEFRDDCDVNKILARCMKTGSPIPGADMVALFADLGQDVTLQSVLDAQISAREAFGSLPEPIKKRFGGDAGLLLRFLEDPGNHDEAVRLGLLNAPAAVPPVVAPAEPAPVVPPPAAPPGAA